MGPGSRRQKWGTVWIVYGLLGALLMAYIVLQLDASSKSDKVRHVDDRLWGSLSLYLFDSPRESNYSGFIGAYAEDSNLFYLKYYEDGILWRLTWYPDVNGFATVELIKNGLVYAVILRSKSQHIRTIVYLADRGMLFLVNSVGHVLLANNLPPMHWRGLTGPLVFVRNEYIVVKTLTDLWIFNPRLEVVFDLAHECDLYDRRNSEVAGWNWRWGGDSVEIQVYRYRDSGVGTEVVCRRAFYAPSVKSPLYALRY